MLDDLKPAALEKVASLSRLVTHASLTTTDPVRLAEYALFSATVSPHVPLEGDPIDLVQRAVDAVQETAVAASLSRGLNFGLALQWVADQLELGADLCSPLDEGVARSHSTDFDLINGLAGQLHYLTFRPSTELNVATRGSLLDRLRTLAQTDAAGSCWRGADAGKVDLGVAHGLAGVVCAMSEVVLKGWATKREVELLESAVSWLLSAQSKHLGPFSFPAIAGGESARLAWCYSDLGIALALERASAALRRPDLRAFALKTALGVSNVSAEAGLVTNTGGLCHGAAGAGWLFGLLAKRLEAPELAHAAHRWFVTSLAPAHHPDAAQTSLLEGATGIGLALYSAATDLHDPPGWARLYCFA